MKNPNHKLKTWVVVGLPTLAVLISGINSNRNEPYTRLHKENNGFSLCFIDRDNYGLPDIGGMRKSQDEQIPIPKEILRKKTEGYEEDNNAEMRGLSYRGLEHIKSSEGFRESTYFDCVGKQTIGYGHLIKKGEKYSTISKEEAENLLRKDIAWAEDTVRNNVKVKLTQGQYDALVSFTYNVGATAFKKSTLLKMLNGGDYEGAANEFKKWNKAGGKVIRGLTIRRLAEEKMFREN